MTYIVYQSIKNILFSLLSHFYFISYAISGVTTFVENTLPSSRRPAGMPMCKGKRVREGLCRFLPYPSRFFS